LTQSHSTNRSNLIWSFLRSIKLTIVLLIVLALVSIFGTIIPQQDQAMNFARSLGPGFTGVFEAFQLFDLYHSSWFRVIIGLLALNLIVCSVDRFPRLWKRFQTLPKPDRSKPFEKLSPSRIVTTSGEFSPVVETVEKTLRTRYKRIHGKGTDDTAFFYGERGRFSLFGVYLVHLSVLFILLGGILGSLLGFEGFVNIPEGDSTDTVLLRRTQVPKKLDFTIQCESFTVEFYDSGTPKEYRSVLNFQEGGKRIGRGDLLVNHPLTVKGITFYQASYGNFPGDQVRLKISSKGRPAGEWDLVVRLKEPQDLPGQEGTIEVMEVRNDLQEGLGPAALVSIKPREGKEVRIMLFQNWDRLRSRFPEEMLKSPRLNPSIFEPYTFSLSGVERKYYTGLQVSKDPGVPLVWIGFVLIVFGLFVTFFASHRRVWIRVAKKSKAIEISIAGQANKNPVGLERDLDHLTEKIRDLF
jgi:cytochrome c biogenesis protein